MSIRLENISVKKNEQWILKNINFIATDKQNWAIIGHNGSGKSTFLDLIAGKIFPTQGTLSIDSSKKIVQVSRDYSFSKIIGNAHQYYQQRYNAHDSEIGPTVYEVLQNQVLPIGTIHTESVELPPLAQTEEKLITVAQVFRIEHLLHRKITSLSNGETRRSLLAYWFLQNPDVLLLDNPFSGLDATSRNELSIVLENLENTQIFLVANKKDIPFNFSNVIQFSEGEIAYCGDIKNVLDNLILPTENWEEKLKKIAQYSCQMKDNSDFITALKLINVNVEYGNKKVLDTINWEVKTGECWAVLGPNGSGKSTLMSLLTGDNPQAYRNEIYLFDKRRGTGESIWEIKQRIGFVSPELHLFFDKQIEVRDMIGSGFFDTLNLFKKLNDQQEKIIDNYLQFFGIEKLKNKQFIQLSSGQQRVILLVRALVKNPSMLVLDEPCQGLDYHQMIFFRDALNVIVQSQQKTLIYITHYLDEIPACVNKTIYLEEGKIVKIKA